MLATAFLAKITRTATILCAALLLGVGCGGDDDDGGAGGGGAAGSGGGSDCPDIGGTWTVAAHCFTDFVGDPAPVTQSGCDLETGAPFAGLSGSIESDGSLTLAGMIEGAAEPLSCTGMATGQQITLACDDSSPEPCDVTLER
jgi:hypothetical protein